MTRHRLLRSSIPAALALRISSRGPAVSRRGLCLLLATALAWSAPVGASGVPASRPSAEERGPSLLLDLAPPRLRLLHGGALLREYAVSSVEVGRPAVLSISRTAVPPETGRIWTLERLDPERRFSRPIILPAAPGADVETVEIPPPPEDAIPAPDRYLLRFGGGLTLEVVGDGSPRDSAWATWPRLARWRLRDLGQSAAWRPEARLRLTLPSPEAGALYRSLPPSVQLIVRQGSE